MSDQRCEVCGETPTSATLHKCVWLPPVVDSKGRKWSAMRGEGGYHLRCRSHPFETLHESAEQ
jgi:hypothetical protein